MPASLSSVLTRGYSIPTGFQADVNLVVTAGYALTGTLPTLVTVAGTITPSSTEDEIRAGGKTITLTLTNDVWQAAGAAFDAIRQDIIDGLVSAQAEPTGWNAAVQPFIPVTAVVRDSDTLVTITLPAFPAYDITATETITATVPVSALTNSQVPVVGAPTFQITPVAPPPTPSGQPHFGGGPFTIRGFCEWTKEDERELEKLEREERELEKRIAKAQRQASRTQSLPERSTAADDLARSIRLEKQSARIDELVTRLARVQVALQKKEEEREEAERDEEMMMCLILEDEE